MFTKNVAAVSVVQALVLGASALGQTVNPLRVIADTDTLVPGGPGNTFQTFFQLDGIDPDISGRNVVFQACCPTGIYGWFNGELRTIADLNSTFPGSGNPLGFDFTSPTISGENVAFSCRNGRPGPGAICAYIDGQLESIAESGVTLVPGKNETFGTFFMLDGAGPSISGKNVAFSAGSLLFNGIYARIDGELITIADNTTAVPGQPGVIFQNFGQLGGSSPSISGKNVAFGGTWSGGGGIYISVDSEIRVVVDTTTQIPGRTENFKGGFPQRPSVSGENVAFAANMNQGNGVFAVIDGQLLVIADPDTSAPGSTGMFGFFPGSPVISGGSVAFGAVADGLGFSIFAHAGGSTKLIASINSAVPGHEPTEFTTFGSDVSPSISGQDVVFFGEAVVPLEHNVFGIYARIIDPPIPATSAWWLVAFACFVLAAGWVLVMRRGRARQPHE